MRTTVPNTTLHLVANQRNVWRWTELHDALTKETGCSSSTARRAINRGLAQGLLSRRDGTYSCATPPPGVAPPQYRRLDRLEMLTILATRPKWRYGEMLHELAENLGAAETTVRASLGYARQFGYLVPTEPGWQLTKHCRHLLAAYGRLEGSEGFRFATFLGGHPRRGIARWSDENRR
jgi:hypothetical protein